MQLAVKPRKVACPGCGETTVYSTSNAYRPFCSERCKLMDLGDWATEKFRIPDATPPDLQDAE
ncbi:DNA gyrase inhibitor YacG [Methylophilus aquaticus]|uniref:DNA gyrase inhibitor YacG n=1 Tax=Methylophilus aquaticus TaxID=1971610 RepID=A0ABT9JQW4_9PROT|nr:DNA gyrase inhibitor YacG [Methylophilus aquaticus]MDP8566948.1 DNA gyrase inhibitor YacG [Methylophilus aquaticus]